MGRKRARLKRHETYNFCSVCCVFDILRFVRINVCVYCVYPSFDFCQEKCKSILKYGKKTHQTLNVKRISNGISIIIVCWAELMEKELTLNMFSLAHLEWVNLKQCIISEWMVKQFYSFSLFIFLFLFWMLLKVFCVKVSQSVLSVKMFKKYFKKWLSVLKLYERMCFHTGCHSNASEMLELFDIAQTNPLLYRF